MHSLFSTLTTVLLMVLSISTYANDTHSDFCEDEASREVLYPNYSFVADWGVRVNRLVARDYNWEDVEVQQRSEIEYEQDVRVTYDQEAVSITSFWEGCESFIGRQGECESDESFSLIIDPDQLNDSLLSQGSIISNDPENVKSFVKPKDDYWEVSDHRFMEKMFSFSMNKDEIDALGDFKQLSVRQALRITVDVNQHLDKFDFEETQLPFSLLTSKEGLYVDSKVILKAMYISSSDQEPAYIPFRIILPENQYRSWCSGNLCGFEYLSQDFLKIESIYKQLSDWTSKHSMCVGGDLLIDGIGARITGSYTEIEKVVFHYEIQTSIINTKEIENFNPLDYLDRDLTLPSKKDAGSLYYLLIGLMILALKRGSKKLKQRSS